MAGDELSADEARRIFLRAQGLLGAPDRRGGVAGLLRSLGAVQLDTISVLARSHELVAYARLGAVGRPAVEAAYWSQPARAYEYWSHAACILPIESWPLYAFRRRKWQANPHRRVEVAALDAVRARLADGPATTTDLGGARHKAGWWEWSEAKVAIETLLSAGEVVCVERRAWKRVYDLAERAVPAALLEVELSDAECHVALVAKAGAHLGVATRDDLADWARLPVRVVDSVVEAAGLVPVAVRGWPSPAYADPVALASPHRGRHRTTLLSPFDSLVWDRARTERVFGLVHRLEAYVPKSKRVHGYFAMPVLAGGRLVGRIDPAREGRTLVARIATLDGPASVRTAAVALREAATWVGCDGVAVERVEPPELAGPLRQAIETATELTSARADADRASTTGDGSRPARAAQARSE